MQILRTLLATVIAVILVHSQAGEHAPSATEKVRNGKAVALDVVLQPGETESVTGNLPGVTVYFDAGSLQVTAGGKAAKVPIQQGEIRPESTGPRFIKNTGASAIRYVRVEFPSGGSTETWGSAGLAPRYKLVSEDRLSRVYDIRIPAHTNEPQHTHHDRIVVCLSGAKLEHLYPDGRREASTLATGEVAWRRGGTHIGQNLGDTGLWVIAIEPK